MGNFPLSPIVASQRCRNMRAMSLDIHRTSKMHTSMVSHIANTTTGTLMTKHPWVSQEMSARVAPTKIWHTSSRTTSASR